jgi:hypothetical protein
MGNMMLQVTVLCTTTPSATKLSPSLTDKHLHFFFSKELSMEETRSGQYCWWKVLRCGLNFRSFLSFGPEIGMRSKKRTAVS